MNNRDGELMPGSLAQVHFKAPSGAVTFIVPAAALIFRREGMQLGTVVQGSSGTVAHLVPVMIGEDDGATVQIVSGLNAERQGDSGSARFTDRGREGFASAGRGVRMRGMDAESSAP